MAVDLKPILYTLPEVTRGDTYPAMNMTYPGDGVLSRVRMKVKSSAGTAILTLDSSTSGITLNTTTDGAWDWTVDKITAATTEDIGAGCYNYDLQVENTSGDVETLIHGTWEILPQITDA